MFSAPQIDVHNGYRIGVRVVLPSFPFGDAKTYDESSRNRAVWADDYLKEGLDPKGLLSYHPTKRSAISAGSNSPCSTRLRAMHSACSVSSVIVPAGTNHEFDMQLSGRVAHERRAAAASSSPDTESDDSTAGAP